VNTDEPNPAPVRDPFLPEPKDTSTVPVRGKGGEGRYKNKGSYRSGFGRGTGRVVQSTTPTTPAGSV
jgi:hypothetical protein